VGAVTNGESAEDPSKTGDASVDAIGVADDTWKLEKRPPEVIDGALENGLIGSRRDIGPSNPVGKYNDDENKEGRSCEGKRPRLRGLEVCGCVGPIRKVERSWATGD
jgi:hypothetical protein